jgi:hypothetical protein
MVMKRDNTRGYHTIKMYQKVSKVKKTIDKILLQDEAKRLYRWSSNLSYQSYLLIFTDIYRL